MIHTRTYASFLLLVAMSLACRDDGLERGRVPGLARELIVPERATEIRSIRRDGFERLTYSVEAEFPAADIINLTADQLSQLGWRPARNDWLNTGYASEFLRGWTQSTVVSEPGGKERFMRQWNAQWSNDTGAIITYGFYYLSPGEELTNTSRLEVEATRLEKETADLLRKQFPPENTAKPLVLLPHGTRPNVELASDNAPDSRAFQMRRDDG